ncbi:uncharacterized protein LOC117152478 isoform X3 [Bombus impatiens]|uniref:Uncharacterized protein LOC117152478 isoform X3 n=1 Tax=Bombus impatiens TaxID=132113 RepID=A0A6P8L8G5_BOMIM|nr:uncharacterized protein LOC117152478 isoform X3 [Bombus impatiens]
MARMFMHLNEDIFTENRNRMDRSTGKDARSCLARHHAFTGPVFGIIMQQTKRIFISFTISDRWSCTCCRNHVSLSSYAGKEPTFHSPGLAAVHRSR